MTPEHRNEILDFVARVNDGYGECTVEHARDFIEGKGYKDAGRELRRLKDAGLLKSWKIGVYWRPGHVRAQGLGRWG